MPEETFAEELLRELREKEAAQKAVELAAQAMRAAIAQLEAPWVLHRSGLEVIRPGDDPFTPYRVCLERFEGIERKVVPYPAAKSESEAIALAEAQCHAERTAYREAARKVATDALKDLGAFEAYNFLLAEKAATKRAREARHHLSRYH